MEGELAAACWSLRKFPERWCPYGRVPQSPGLSVPSAVADLLLSSSRGVVTFAAAAALPQGSCEERWKYELPCVRSSRSGLQVQTSILEYLGHSQISVSNFESSNFFEDTL